MYIATSETKSIMWRLERCYNTVVLHTR